MADDRHTENQTDPPSDSAPVNDDHEFLIPGPTPTSNEGCFTWGASWVVVSLVLLVIVAVMTVACFFISLLVGLL